MVFGNPNVFQKKIIDTKSILDDLFPKLAQSEFPNNNSSAVKEELNDIVSKTNDILLEENAEILKIYSTFDKNIRQVIVNAFLNHNIDVTETVNDIFSDMQPLIYKLKFRLNRPRPSQLAGEFLLKLFPVTHKSMETPSYPSMHATFGIVCLKVLEYQNDQYAELCRNMTNAINNSCLYLGLHFASDIDYSFEVAEMILKHKEFNRKYGI